MLAKIIERAAAMKSGRSGTRRGQARLFARATKLKTATAPARAVTKKARAVRSRGQRP